MAGRSFTVGPNIKVQLHDEEFVKLRKVQPLHALLHARGEEWIKRLNDELHAAQAKRRQPVEDGYTFHITNRGTRLRLYIVAATARAQAHERAHSSILKLMETTNYDVKTRAQLEKKAAATAAAHKRRASRLRGQQSDLSPSEHPIHDLDPTDD